RWQRGALPLSYTRAAAVSEPGKCGPVFLAAHHHYRRTELFSRLLGRQRRCPGRRRTAALADVGRPFPRILGIAHLIEIRGGAAPRLLVKLPKKRNAPAAARTGSAALGKLAGYLGRMNSDELGQLATSDMEAVAYLGVDIHATIIRHSEGSCSIAVLKRP